MTIVWEGCTIHLTVRSNCKRLTLRYRLDTGTFSLTVPPCATKEQVLLLLRSSSDWMQAQAALRLPVPSYEPGTCCPVLGRMVTLGEEGVPSGATAFLQWRNDQLLALLQSEVLLWGRKMQLWVRQIKVQPMRTRWGSCAPLKQELHFSTRLGFVPAACVTLIVVHELCHMFYPNHSKDFYSALAHYLPDWQERKALLEAHALDAPE